MKDTIVQAVRDARADVAADFDYDLHKFFAWAKAHTAAEQKAKRWLPIGPSKALKKTDGAPKSPATQKRRVRPARSST